MPKKGAFPAACISILCFPVFRACLFLVVHWLLWLISFVVLVLDLWLLLLNVVFGLLAVVVVVVVVVALLLLLLGCQ